MLILLHVEFWLPTAPWAESRLLSQPRILLLSTGLLLLLVLVLTIMRVMRRRQLAAGRLKILRGEWFDGLSPTTRVRFFYQLLMDLLAEESHAQREVLLSESYRKLHACQQVHVDWSW